MPGETHNRWSNWARAIASRHLRFTQRRDSLDLVLLRLRSPLRIIRERSMFTTRIVRPSLYLTISTFLPQRRKGAKAERTLLSAFVPLREKTSSPTLRLVSQAQKEVRSERTIRDLRFERQTETERLRKPLTFVFERVNTSKTSAHSNRLEVLVHQHARSIVERVTRQSRRNETMHIGGGDTLITRHMSSSSYTEVTQPRVLKTVTMPTRVIEKTTHEPTVTTVVETAAWLQDKVPVAGLNIDQITDQVVKQLDRRVVAARERMGRV